ncbi:glycosyl transferase [Actinokineospora fastidiosa]|uniref:Glycosyl transferase n=1 Tax=Actinokineospora fastidiosa TaxID=1816 RepID=A0A918G948_9PSEU|nr:glycosyl transferase [Actinokineospora fastidiosa]
MPVLAVLVCHDGAEWLRLALSALRHATPRPRHVIAVDTGSADDTPGLLAAAATGDDRVLDGVLTLDRSTGYTDAVHAAVDHAVERWGDPGGWIWLLHDDSAPDPDCLANLLNAADLAPSAAVLGPLAVDWRDPRMVVGAGLSTDASGHRQTGIGPSELDWTRLGREFEQSTEVLAVSSAGMLVRRAVWQELGGFDRAVPVLREDIDFGWRVNRSGRIVLCVPSARVRHARAMTTELRGVDVAVDGLAGQAALDRAMGLRTFLVNCGLVSFLLGVPRLAALCLLRSLGFAMQRRLTESAAELRALSYVLSGRAGLWAGRRARAVSGGPGPVRGLFTSRTTRLRNVVRGAVSALVRRRVAADAALGRLPVEYDPATVWLPPTPGTRRPLAGPEALPAGAAGRPRRAGLRRPSSAVAVSIPVEETPGLRPSPQPRPSPVPRDGSGPPPEPDLVLVSVDRGRVVRQLLLSPPLLLAVGLLALAVVVNIDRAGLALAGGRLLPVGDLGAVWAEYLAAWHGVAGGTAAPTPAAMAVIGTLGLVLAPVGGTQAAVALLLLADLPLAGLSAYLATRRAPVRRWVRALLATGYALLPTASAAVAQGRLDAVVVHILLPLVTAGVIALLARTGATRRWLSTAAGTAFGLAVIGAFAPLAHVVLVIVALGGFVLVPGDGRRRGAALFMLVLMPLALLLPWPAVVIQHPGVVVHGLGAPLPTPPVGVPELLALDAGGPGAWPYLGALLVIAVLVGVVLRPYRGVLPGLGFALLGALAVAFVQLVPMTPLGGLTPSHGWAGTPLLIVGWGLVWALMGLCRTGGRVSLVRPVAVAGVAALGALAAGVVVAGPVGPLDDDGGPRLASSLTAELAQTRRWVLTLDGHPRLTAGRLPALGDDDLAPPAAAVDRLARWADDLRSGDGARVRPAVARAAAAGVLFIVLPEDAGFAAAAGDLVAAAPPTTDGLPVFRVQLTAGPSTLLSPELARTAVTGGVPPTSLAAEGVVPVDATPPAAAARVSDGPEGRLLVVGANEEPGWTATVDGRQVPVVRAWDHQVAVSLPTRAAEVRVEQPTALRGVLLLVQGAMVLFTVLTSIPGRRPD